MQNYLEKRERVTFCLLGGKIPLREEYVQQRRSVKTRNGNKITRSWSVLPNDKKHGKEELTKEGKDGKEIFCVEFFDGVLHGDFYFTFVSVSGENLFETKATFLFGVPDNFIELNESSRCRTLFYYDKYGFPIVWKGRFGRERIEVCYRRVFAGGTEVKKIGVLKKFPIKKYNRLQLNELSFLRTAFCRYAPFLKFNYGCRGWRSELYLPFFRKREDFWDAIIFGKDACFQRTIRE
ncbi:hypothetical protein GMAR_ORF108 [Golden Marseillevirus]|uniref:hypothetical protein n=1 Tax=Golden Marseillevirus TaxID=1720526 RepID=UPI000877AE7A|nr:hypothetical protein GMAR_ORF108 [Golden Marseillevirus]ALX27482.1 hypothetical protein GMAR_ORF108 [Golden Marseillevirus]